MYDDTKQSFDFNQDYRKHIYLTYIRDCIENSI